ncbi:UDP-N-acetylmuramate--L-alanine ligase [Striga asiatica]|uniref:UDP-N-acetylmuramate--L-alanine ligase n=1 Tax=Striga asiatica TaxID=4170 RepID=A0A5A7RD46_STRAF|nr:UDP-N-acetylmuramate--L-alanine ligase [Striga asiatica]
MAVNIRRRMSEIVGQRRRWAGGIGHMRWQLRWALVAFSEKPKCVDLVDKIGHAGPSTKPKPNYQNPNNYKYVDHISPNPSSKTVKLTRSEPTVELMGPKNGKIIARNHMGTTTGNRAAARLHMLRHSCIPIAFSHTKYNGVQANPNRYLR